MSGNEYMRRVSLWRALRNDPADCQGVEGAGVNEKDSQLAHDVRDAAIRSITDAAIERNDDLVYHESGLLDVAQRAWEEGFAFGRDMESKANARIAKAARRYEQTRYPEDHRELVLAVKRSRCPKEPK